MGIINKIVTCDCFNKKEEYNDDEKIYGCRMNTNDDDNNMTEIRSHVSHSKSVYIKAPIPEYFDGKIDAKDYIQKGESLGNYEKIKRIGKGSYGFCFSSYKKKYKNYKSNEGNKKKYSKK